MGPPRRLCTHRHGAGPALNARAFGFDFDHTLGIDNKLERVAFLRLLEEACCEGARSGTLAQETAAIDALLQRQRKGEFSIEHAAEMFVRERGIADASGYAERYKTIALESVNTFVIAEPNARRLFTGLDRLNLPYAILSNGWSPLQERKAERVGFSGPVIVSAAVGVQKPDRGAFHALTAALDCPADAVAYVGDNPEIDVAGALAAGMQAVWFDAEGLRYPKELPAPNAVIHNLAELLDLL